MLHVTPTPNNKRAPDEWFTGAPSDYGDAAELVEAVRRRRAAAPGQGPVDACAVGRLVRPLTPLEQQQARAGLFDPGRIVIPVCIAGYSPSEVLAWLRRNADADGAEILGFV
jgi:hypothetical protein